MTTQPYKSLKLKTIKVKDLVVGDIIMYGGAKSGALHRIVKMQGVKQCKRSTRLVYKAMFYAIIRKGVVIIENDNPRYTLDFNPHLDSTREIMDNIPTIV